VLSHISPAAPARLSSITPNAHVEQLIGAARDGEPLELAMEPILRELEFDSFMYGMSANPLPAHRDTRAFVWTTLPKEWVRLYAAKAYVEIDPRVTLTYNRSAPFVWDAIDFAGDPRYTEFFADAKRFGVCSGVAIHFRDPSHGRILVAYNSRISPVDEARRQRLSARLGSMVLLATTFHDVFMASIVDTHHEGANSRSPLSPRELQCLALAANGMTSCDIGIKLGITERTANFHFRNLIGKLGVLNRQEAIAVGIARGLVRRDPAMFSTEDRLDGRAAASRISEQSTRRLRARTM
jgi:LuxR family transcriptional regulator, quorum-sensing system regulator LasR